MRRIIASLANANFRVDEDLIQYRYQLSIDPGVRTGYSAFMRWIEEQRGLHRPAEFLARLKHQTLVVHGKQDRVVPLASAYRLLELIDNSRGYIMPHCGHWAMMEYPEVFSRVTLDFLLSDA
jgi:pimeloyl-ACP methyl ester carboxylesterase